MTNNTYKEIALKLHGYDKVLIFPHVNMDGDCLGSSAALCHVLRGFGKEAYVLADDVTPSNLDFLESGVVTRDYDVFDEYDLAILVDCGSKSRITMGCRKMIQSSTLESSNRAPQQLLSSSI